MSQVLVEVRRGGYVESVHRGSVAVVDPAGMLVAHAGDPEAYTFMRSAAKPIQALAIVESGAYEAFGLTEKELAVMCASHSSEPGHVATVLGALAKIGLDESHLQCGTHLPTHTPSAHALIREGREPTAVHCNCSGKHAGMLAVAKKMGWGLEDYWHENHPLQRLCLDNVASVAGYRASRIGVARDGCGVSVFALPLRNMAQAFARLANPDDPKSDFGPARASAASLIVRAMRAHPDMVAGTGRLCTVLMEATPVVAKGGAEAVYCFGVPGWGLGCALKIEDGNSRAVGPAVVRVLENLGLVSPPAARSLEPFSRLATVNHRGEVVGVTEAVFGLGARKT
ncbi:MAG: asparaginase [Bacillota bacterium]|nr:MAG: asparaginase [Bacillota bacterium]